MSDNFKNYTRPIDQRKLDLSLKLRKVHVERSVFNAVLYLNLLDFETEMSCGGHVIYLPELSWINTLRYPFDAKLCTSPWISFDFSASEDPTNKFRYQRVLLDTFINLFNFQKPEENQIELVSLHELKLTIRPKIGRRFKNKLTLTQNPLDFLKQRIIMKKFGLFLKDQYGKLLNQDTLY